MLSTASFTPAPRNTAIFAPPPRSARPRRILSFLPAGSFNALPARHLGRYMETSDLCPDLVILSGDPAAQTTWSALEPFFGDPPRLWMEPQFDKATLDECMDILRSAPCEAEKILLIANAPALLQMAATLACGYAPLRARNARQQAQLDFPSGALAVVTLSLPRWSGLAPQTGLMKAFVRREDLLAQV